MKSKRGSEDHLQHLRHSQRPIRAAVLDHHDLEVKVAGGTNTTTCAYVKASVYRWGWHVTGQHTSYLKGSLLGTRCLEMATVNIYRQHTAVKSVTQLNRENRKSSCHDTKSRNCARANMECRLQQPPGGGAKRTAWLGVSAHLTHTEQ